MGSEDFLEALAGTETPCTFILIGIAPMDKFVAAQKAGRRFPCANTNPDCFVDLPAIPMGANIDTVAALAMPENE